MTINPVFHIHQFNHVRKSHKASTYHNHPNGILDLDSCCDIIGALMFLSFLHVNMIKMFPDLCDNNLRLLHWCMQCTNADINVIVILQERNYFFRSETIIEVLVCQIFHQHKLYIISFMNNFIFCSAFIDQQKLIITSCYIVIYTTI